jgi:hypothetical protein
MNTQNVLSEYLSKAMSHAEYDKLDDGTFAGRIACCKGVIAFAPNLHECAAGLRSTLEDWLLVGLKLGHALPVVDGLDLNKEPAHEPVESV